MGTDIGYLQVKIRELNDKLEELETQQKIINSKITDEIKDAKATLLKEIKTKKILIGDEIKKEILKEIPDIVGKDKIKEEVLIQLIKKEEVINEKLIQLEKRINYKLENVLKEKGLMMKNQGRKFLEITTEERNLMNFIIWLLVRGSMVGKKEISDYEKFIYRPINDRGLGLAFLDVREYWKNKLKNNLSELVSIIEKQEKEMKGGKKNG